MLEQYLELSKVSQDMEKENRILRDALLKLDGLYNEIQEVIKQKDELIADLMIQKSRCHDLLLLKTEDLERAKQGYKIPAEKSNFIDRLLRGAQ